MILHLFDSLNNQKLAFLVYRIVFYVDLADRVVEIHHILWFDAMLYLMVIVVVSNLH